MSFSEMDWCSKVELTQALGKSIAQELVKNQMILREITTVLGEAIGKELAKAMIATAATNASGKGEA